MAKDKLRTEVKNDSQRYMDQPVYARSKAELTSTIAKSISQLFHNGQDFTPRKFMVGHRRVALTWVTPDGKGGTKLKHPKEK